MPQITAIKTLQSPKISNEILSKPRTKFMIYRRNGAANGNATIYTVPVGKGFFLQSAYLTWAEESNGGSVEGTINGDAQIYTQESIIILQPMMVKRTDAVSMGFGDGLYFRTGTTFKVASGAAGGIADAGICGFEIDVSELPLFQ